MSSALSTMSPPADVPPPAPTTSVGGKKKKSSTKKPNKMDPAIRKQRREIIETRILKLEGKLTKDRTLLLRYVDEDGSTSADDGIASLAPTTS